MIESNDLEAQLLKQIEECRGELAAAEKTVADAQIRVKNLEDDLNSFITALETFRRRVNKAASPSEGRFRGLTIAEAAEALLREAGRPLKAKEISEALTAGGVRLAKTPYIQVHGALSNNHRFVRKGKAEFALAPMDSEDERSL